MPIDQRLLALVGLVTLATFVGLWVISISGRASRIKNGEQVDLAQIGATKNGQKATKLGEKVTLLQFSSDFCSNCKQTSNLLSKMEQSQKGLLHIDLDISNRLDLAKTYSILQTPTILVLNSSGKVVSRIVGPPKLATIESEIERLVINDAKQN